MSRLVTQLVTDQPAIVLVGEDTLLREKIAFNLQEKNVGVTFVHPLDLKENATQLQTAYKVLWIYEQDAATQEYLTQIQLLAEIKAQLIIVLPVFSGITQCQSTIFQDWVVQSTQQLQFIVDANYYLPSVSFIFGQNIVGNNIDLSLFKFVFTESKNAIFIDPLAQLQFISLEDFAVQVTEFVFIPKKQMSMLITGRPVESTHFIAIVKKLYDTYHTVSAKIVQDQVTFSKLLPFSVSEKILNTDTRALATYLVRNLPAPATKESDYSQLSSTSLPQPTGLQAVSLQTQVQGHAQSPTTTGQTTTYQHQNQIKPTTQQEQEMVYQNETTSLQETTLRQVDQNTQETTNRYEVFSQTVQSFESPQSDQLTPHQPHHQHQNQQQQNHQQQTYQQSLQTQIQAYAQAPTTTVQTTTYQQLEVDTIQTAPSLANTAVSNKIAPTKPTETLDLNSEIQRIFKDTRTEKKVERVEKIVKSTKTISSKSKRKTKLFYAGLVSVGLATGMLVLALVYFVSGSVLKKQIISFLTTTSKAQELQTIPGASLVQTTKFVAAQTNLYSQIIELQSIAQNSVLVTISEQFLVIPEILETADQASKNLVLNILNGNIGQTAELTEILTQSVSKAYEKLSLVQATLEQVDFGEHSEQQQSVIDQIGTKIQEIRAGLEIHQQLQQVLPSMVGVSEKRTYALLLQNNQEIRPTGGFIQAVALLNFDKGSLVSYQVYSVYDLDRKLLGQVVPPEEIKTHLGETNWYLRDSNWDPDFPKTSKQVIWFIEKSLGATVDGVIGINVFSLEDLVAAVGPLDLPEYNEVITQRNIEERMEFHSEVVLVDSPESVDYSVKILTKILEQLTRLKADAVPVLLSGLQNSIDTKQTLIYSTRESEQSILQSLGWTGTVTPPSCPSRLSVVSCLVDTIAQVEANIGVNKANYYLERAIKHEITVSKTTAQHTRSIVFENKAQSNAWPKGTYQSFQRFYVNSNVVVEKVLINGLELNEKQITQTQEDGFKVIGVRVDVPIQKQVELQVIYSTPLSDADSFSYVFYNRKQSGLDADPLTVQITHSPDIKPILIAPSATITGNTITFSAQSLDDASLFGVQFE